VDGALYCNIAYIYAGTEWIYISPACIYAMLGYLMSMGLQVETATSAPSKATVANGADVAIHGDTAFGQNPFLQKPLLPFQAC